MTFVRPFAFATVVTVLCAVDLWAVAGVLCGVVFIASGYCRARVVSAPSELRRRQLDTVVERQEVRR